MSQFEDELVKIWNKPKFVLNSNYVITLDRIIKPSPLMGELEGAGEGANWKLLERILNHPNFNEQVKEWRELGIVDEKFKVEDILKNSPFVKGCQTKGLTGYLNLPYNPKLKERARELRKAGNLSEVLLWNKLKQGQMLGFDFTRQQIIGNYIVDFHCPKLRLVIEIDGESHDFKGEYDEERDKYLQSLGLTVLHFKDLDIKNSLNEVLMQIESWIKNSPFYKRSTSEAVEVLNTPSALQTPLLGKGELNTKYKHLPLDTKYFKDLEFEILGLFNDGSTSLTTGLDNALDGWLIKSENYQALNTILPKFKEKVQAVYIDPPYNAATSEIHYVNTYKDSSWITLMENRIFVSKELLSKEFVYMITIDDVEQRYLGDLLKQYMFPENSVNCIIVVHNQRGQQGKNLSAVHEYVYFIYPDDTNKYLNNR